MQTLSGKLQELGPMSKVAANPRNRISQLELLRRLIQRPDLPTTKIPNYSKLFTMNAPQLRKIQDWSAPVQSTLGTIAGYNWGGDAYGQLGSTMAGSSTPNFLEKLLGASSGFALSNPSLRRLWLSSKGFLPLTGKLVLSGAGSVTSRLPDIIKATKDKAQSVLDSAEGGLQPILGEFKNLQDEMDKGMDRTEKLVNSFFSRANKAGDRIQSGYESLADSAAPLAGGALGATAGGVVGNQIGNMLGDEDDEEEDKKKKKSISTLLGTAGGGLAGYYLGGGFDGETPTGQTNT